VSSSSTHLPTPAGAGSVCGAPNLPAGFTDTFTNRYVDAGEPSEQRKSRPLTMPVLGIGGGGVR
jgi:hypothetical protein